MNFRAIEKKWQKAWAKKKLFESNPSNKKKFFTSLIIPYVNGNIHIGHSFTYSRTDAYARFKRMQGYNVLLAQGFHATGEPILGAVDRLKENDKSQINTFKMFGATAKDLEDFKKKGAEYVAQFWKKKIIESMKMMGFSIDWRREFITAINPTFNRFIEWQYNTLKKKGYIVKAPHHVVWCPRCKSPTGDHDRSEGEGETLKEFIWAKFKLKDTDLTLMAGTTRPDALLGQTNLWVDPSSTYMIVKVGNEKWIVGEGAIKKIENQLGKAEVIGTITAPDLIGKWAKGPLVDYELYILPASFIDANVGSGLVYSALEDPVDLLELKKLQHDPELIKKYNLDAGVVAKLKPIPIINVTGMGEDLGEEISREFGVKSSEDEEKLSKAKGELNKRVFRKGVMKENCGKYAGMRVPEAQAVLNKDLIESSDATMFYELTGKVVCRCLTECTIKLVSDQWFLKYSDEGWKKKTRYALKKMMIIPDEARQNFENTIDWLKDKACTRRTGLGTKLPWDKEWIVETLSDSTVYMAYYTIARVINEKKIPADKLTDEVFDYIFLSKGNPKPISKNSKLPLRLLLDMKKEFEYFYPVDFRNSAKELVQNHLTFYIFHHIAIWPEKYWPKIIGANGFVSVEGDKMSKSKGNIIPLKELTDLCGVDLTRLNIVSSSDGLDDADWRAENIKSLRQRYDLLFDVVKNLRGAKNKKISNAELYLISKLQNTILTVTESYEHLEFRSAVQHALFESTNALKWYLNRVGGIKNANRNVLKEAMKIIVKLLTPITPHLCEEVWNSLDRGFVSVVEWPKKNAKLVNIEAEKSEEFLKQIIMDIEEIKKISGIKPTRVIVLISQPWKFKIYSTIMKNKNKGINEITKEIMQTDMKKYGNATIGFIQGLYKKLNELQEVVPREKQFVILSEAKSFLEEQLQCKVSVEDAEKSTHQKAKQATPQKPGILLE